MESRAACDVQRPQVIGRLKARAAAEAHAEHIVLVHKVRWSPTCRVSGAPCHSSHSDLHDAQCMSSPRCHLPSRQYLRLIIFTHDVVLGPQFAVLPDGRAALGAWLADVEQLQSLYQRRDEPACHATSQHDT